MNAMGLFESFELRCPSGQNCSEWAKTNFNYCLCGTKDVVSLILGLISVLSWGVAEVPQIITNFREKSTEGISILFLMTWIIGDFLNLIGCKLEPATLPTQYYTAILYTMTTLILATQTIYYSHIYPKLKSNRRCHKNDMVEKNRWHINDIDGKPIDGDDLYGNRNSTLPSGVAPSMPIPLLAHSRLNEGELYYTSARSLSRSHTPPVGFHMQRRMSSLYEQSSFEEPLIGGHLPNLSVPPSKTKTMLCVVSGLILFLNLSNLQLAKGRSVVYGKENGGTVVLVGRKLLQATESLFRETGNTESAKVGSFLGWGMAAIYLGGRLPQILLNFRRGNAQGLNPLMFVFALVGNITYVASILVSSLEWSKIRPNLPWLVDAGGCVALDSVILIQFIYFRYHQPQDLEINNGISNIT